MSVNRLISSFKKRLSGEAGNRFKRFALAAVIALAASQITLTICLGVLNLTGGLSGFLAWVAGATTSYVMSRWAWEKKGRPDLLRETVPFWIIAVCVAALLTTVAHFASVEASRLGLINGGRVVFVDAMYFLANCVTFLSRFLIFHYFLFANEAPTTLRSGYLRCSRQCAKHIDSPDGLHLRPERRSIRANNKHAKV